MTMLTALAALVVAQAAQSAPAAPPAPTPAIDWSAAARGDIEAGYAMMKDSHAGWYNSDDAAFRPRLERAREAGLSAAAEAKDANGLARALNLFSAELGDGHALLAPTNSDGAATKRWPGFLTAWRGDGLYIVEGSAAPGLGLGARLVACDGVGANDYVVQRLSGTRARLREHGQWWAYGGAALLDDSSRASGPSPTACTFAPAGGGADVAVTLDWQPQTDGFAGRYWKAVNGDYHDIGLTEPRAGMFVIGMPTFAVNAAGGASYRALYKAVAERHAALANARAIVLDLRMNQGGSSAWPRGLAAALWGDKATETRMETLHRAVEIWWRGSSANIAYLAEMEAFLAKSGQTEFADHVRKLAVRMTADAAAGKPMTVDEPADLSKPAPVKARASLTTPVYVIVPGQCASACLDALDIFTQFDNVRLIGAPSSGDSIYMEIREAPLPSGKADAVIPIKLWKNRARAGGQVYQPHIPLRQADWSTGAFLDAIEADLSKRGLTR